MRRVVVTSIGIVSPIGVGKKAFYDGLSEGRSGISAITRFDAATFPTRIGAEIREPVMSASLERELTYEFGELVNAIARDRKSEFGIVAAEEARLSAFGANGLGGYASERVGLSVAAGLELLNVQDLMEGLDGDAFSLERFIEMTERYPQYARAAVPSDIAARIIRKRAGINGPFSVNLSACAASTQAIGGAFLAIRDGVVDAMLAGGYDSMLNPLGLGGFCLLEAMTKSNELGANASRPFDITRDGFVLGEGAAFFVLECRDSAVRRGATILGEVTGYGSTLDAYRVTDPEPNGDGAYKAMAAALSMACVQPEELDYINAHGTATPKNDPVEARAIQRLLGSEVFRVYVSSTKSQLGHLIGAAGAVEFAACLFALERQRVPATITLDRPDPACSLRHVPKTPIDTEVRRVLSNSLGFGGQNASILLGQHDTVSPRSV